MDIEKLKELTIQQLLIHPQRLIQLQAEAILKDLVEIEKERSNPQEVHSRLTHREMRR